MSTSLIGIAVFLMLFASITDLLYYRIPNTIVGLLFVLFPIFILTTNQSLTLSHYSLFLIVLCFGFMLFYFGLIGGGDAKLLSVVTLWMGWSKIIPFLLLMGVIGGALGLIFLLIPNVIKNSTTKGRHFLQRQPALNHLIKFLIAGNAEEIDREILAMQQVHMVPYGLAITAAAMILL